MNSSKIKNAMIFAAGLGTRMRPLTLTTPKPLAKVLDKPLLEYKIEYLKNYGIEKIIINCHHLAEQVEDYITKKQYKDIILVKEDTLLDTGGGLINALEYLGNEPFFVTNSDTIHIDSDKSGLESMEHLWLNKQNINMDMLMLLIEKDRAIGYKGNGDFNITADNNLQWQQDAQDFVYTGLMILDPKVLLPYSDRGKFSLRDIWIDNTSKSNGVIKNTYASIFEGSWLHIDSVEGIKNAELTLKN